MWELAVDGIQQAPVAGTPAVDALLDVANNQILSSFVTHTLLQQYLEILPLDGILKLVNHDVLQLAAYLLEDEGGVAVADKGVEQLLRVAEQEAV